MPVLNPISMANPASSPACFAIVYDTDPRIRLISGSVTLTVRDEIGLLRDDDFQTWCEDNLAEGVYGKYDGVDLHLYFATSHDQKAAAERLKL